MLAECVVVDPRSVIRLRMTTTRCLAAVAIVALILHYADKWIVLAYDHPAPITADTQVER